VCGNVRYRMMPDDCLANYWVAAGGFSADQVIFAPARLWHQGEQSSEYRTDPFVLWNLREFTTVVVKSEKARHADRTFARARCRGNPGTTAPGDRAFAP
jgi:hypothetical protein